MILHADNGGYVKTLGPVTWGAPCLPVRGMVKHIELVSLAPCLLSHRRPVNQTRGKGY